MDFSFANRGTIKAQTQKQAKEGTFEHELALLIYSEKLYHWCELCGLTVTGCLAEINVVSNYDFAEKTTVDVKTVGCRFSVGRVTTFLRSSDSKGGTVTTTRIEHCWSLSNSCGVLVDPADTKRFVSLTFDEDTRKAGEDEASISSTMGDYLVYALSLYDKSIQKSSAGQTQLYEGFTSRVRTYLSDTDLMYDGPRSNPLITGILYDMCIDKGMYASTYRKNLEDFSVFEGLYLPVLDEVFEFNWLKSPRDHRLLFDIDPSELLTEIPKMNVVDATFVLGNKLVGSGQIKHNEGMEELEDKLEAVLLETNKGVEKEALWISFFIYYGMYRCAKTRVVSRPEVFVLPSNIAECVGVKTVIMSGVEEVFSKLQEKKNVNIRRAFNAHKFDVALCIFKRLNIGFSPISRLRIPEEFAYMNVDYLKRVNTDGLTEEEATLVASICKDIDKMCLDRDISIAFKDNEKKKKRDTQCIQRFRKHEVVNVHQVPGTKEKLRPSHTLFLNIWEGHHKKDGPTKRSADRSRW